MLKKILHRALKAGGSQMSTSNYPKLFGNDEKLRRDVLYACNDPHIQHAIDTLHLVDHRVIQAFRKMGPVATHLVIALEIKRGRKLIRSRIDTLAKVFCRIRDVQEPSINSTANKPQLRVVQAIRRVA